MKYLLIPVFLMFSACEEVKQGNACDDYVSYMCDCHSDDCSDLHNIYENPTDQELEDCSQSLDSQQTEDEEEGNECDLESTDTGL